MLGYDFRECLAKNLRPVFIAGTLAILVAGCAPRAIYHVKQADAVKKPETEVYVPELPSPGDIIETDEANTKIQRQPLDMPPEITNSDLTQQKTNIAPSASATTTQNDSNYIVQNGDTVYSISRRYDIHPRTLISTNNLQAPFHLSIGQTLKIPQNQQKKFPWQGQKNSAATSLPKTPAAPQPITKSAAGAPPKNATPIASQPKTLRFAMPVQSSLPKSSDSSNGVKISSYEKEHVKSAEAGEVIYVGQIEGYGNIILIKHNDEWVTNYARLQSITTRKGDIVAQGQTIGLTGKTPEFSTPQLWFEIRKNGVTVDPIPYLKGKTITLS